MCILEFKYVGCECVQDFLVAWKKSSVVDTCIKELDELRRGFGMMVWVVRNNPPHNWGVESLLVLEALTMFLEHCYPCIPTFKMVCNSLR